MELNNRTIHWTFQEQWSLSGRTSRYAVNNFAVGFPVDYRFGWDLDYPPHRALIDKCDLAFRTLIKLSSPDCRMRSIASNTMDPEKKKFGRQKSVALLEWFHGQNHRQIQKGGAAVNENPKGSSMWHKSPLKKNGSIGMHKKHGDQCAGGAVHPKTNVPAKKATTWDTNIELRSSVKPYPGHSWHDQLQDKDPDTGLFYTTLAAIYPKKLSKGPVSNFVVWIRGNQCNQSHQTKEW